MRRLAILLLCLLTPVSASALSMQDLVGIWYGEGYQPMVDRDMQWIVERRADGTFNAEFRIVRDCQVEVRQLESGHWGIYDKGFYTLVDMIDGVEVGLREPHAYTVERIDENSIDYTYVALSIRFKATRVQHGFSMPACVS